MKVVTVVGTRPNFIKEISLNTEFSDRGIKEILIHTGQHYDYNMFKQFFADFNLPDPDYSENLSDLSGGKRLGKMIEFIENILLLELPDVCVVMGDVHSTLAGALAASFLKIPIVHIEAGLRGRTFFSPENNYSNQKRLLSNPEEINRVLSDNLSELLLTVCQSGTDNLLNEGYPKECIFNTGDLMLDTFKKFVPIIQKKNKLDEDYILVTIHREENTDNKNNLNEIINALIESGQKIYFPVHPRTKNKLVEFGKWKKLNKEPLINLLEPVGYFDFMHLLYNSKKIITDSGGVRREAYFFGKAIINCSPIIWFPEIIEAGWKVHVGPDKDAILESIQNFNPSGHRPNIFGNGKSAKKIVDKIIHYFN